MIAALTRLWESLAAYRQVMGSRVIANSCACDGPYQWSAIAALAVLGKMSD